MTRDSHRSPLFVSAIALIAGFLAATATFGQPSRPPAIGTKDRAAIIESLVKGLGEIYVFPDVAAKMAAYMRERLASGAYDAHTELPAFCRALTDDLRAVSHDKHVGVRWEPPPPEAAGRKLTDEERHARFAAEQRRDNYCFRKVERLPGNIGCLKLDCFAPAEDAGPTAVAAMSFLANSDALIFDLRENGGGTPSMIQLISSYLFGEPQHLNSFYIREDGSTQQFWTQAHVDGKKLPDVPAFVLTSSYTFSGAEEFTYNLKNMKRATIIGETTGGGAHPVRRWEIEGYPVSASIPFGRAVNPITGTNWEGTGIEPDIAVPAADALLVAQEKALEAIGVKATDPDVKAETTWMRESLAAQRTPFPVDAAALPSYVGTYGPRRITLEAGVLWYQREGRQKVRLVPMAKDLFFAPDLDGFRIAFERDAAGVVTRLNGLYASGFSDGNDRSGR